MSQLEKSNQIVLTVLGSGTSQGVPMIGCDCAVCLSSDPRDVRSRCSIYLQTPEASVLVDATPDLRHQALREKVRSVDAVFFTHAHADHIMGFDDLRRFCEINRRDMPIYGHPETLQTLAGIFHYAFDQDSRIPGYVRAIQHPVTKPFSWGGLDVTPLLLPHGSVTSTGYLFSRQGRNLLAYMTDCNAVPDAVQKIIAGVEVLFLDAVRDSAHMSHFNIAGAIQAAARIGARRTYFTHLAHDKSHAQRSSELPRGIELAYDGQKIEFAWG